MGAERGHCPEAGPPQRGDSFAAARINQKGLTVVGINGTADRERGAIPSQSEHVRWSLLFQGHMPPRITKHLAFTITAHRINSPNSILLVADQGLIGPLAIATDREDPVGIQDLVA